ncbi:trypsin-like peptidase domain-containing protein [Microlunatus endophyticus]
MTPTSWPRGLVVAQSVAALLIAGIVGGVVGSLITTKSSGSATSPTACQVSEVAAKVLPAVVTIAVSGSGGSGTGSGVIIDRNGTVVTNNHVIAAGADGGRIEATLDDGSQRSAELIGRDPATDIAVLRLQGVAACRPSHGVTPTG